MVIFRLGNWQAKPTQSPLKAQVEGEVIHVIVEKCFDLTRMYEEVEHR